MSKSKISLKNGVASFGITVGDHVGGRLPAWNMVIASGETSTDLSNFPVRIELGQLPDSFWTFTNDGLDVRATVSGSEIPTDLVEIDMVNKRGTLWVKVPTLATATDTTIVLSADGVSTRPASGATYGMYAVWADYKCVYIPNQSIQLNRCNGNIAFLTGSFTVDEVAGVTGRYGLQASGSNFVKNNDGSGRLMWSVPTISNSTDGAFTMLTTLLEDTISQAAVMFFGKSDNTTFIMQIIDNGNQLGVFQTDDSWTYPSQQVNPITTDMHIYSVKHRDSGAGGDQYGMIDGDFSNRSHNATPTDLTAKGYNRFIPGGVISAGASSDNDGYLGFSYMRYEYMTDAWQVAEHRMLKNPYFAEYDGLTTVSIGSNIDVSGGTSTGWTLSNMILADIAVNRIPNAPYGNYYFEATNTIEGYARQNIDVSAYSTDIDAGKCFIEFLGSVSKDFADLDSSQLSVKFLNGAASELWRGGSGNGYPAADNWIEYLIGLPVPANTRTIRLEVLSQRIDGSNSNSAGAFDFINLLTKA